MVRYATCEKYNIEYDEIAKEFHISSVHDNRPIIGYFKIAADAINFAEVRVVQTGRKL